VELGDVGDIEAVKDQVHSGVGEEGGIETSEGPGTQWSWGMRGIFERKGSLEYGGLCLPPTPLL